MSSYLNKSRIKKVYGYERYQPQYVQVAINELGTTEIIEISRRKIDRQFYFLPGKKEYSTINTASYYTGEYEENISLVSLNVTQSTVTFATPFSFKPVVTIEILTSSNDLYNVNNFIKNITINGFDINFSSQFSGSFKYRAIYAANYPIIAERLPLLPSSYYTASAGSTSLNNSSTATITYSNLYETPTELFLGVEDSGNNMGQVFPQLSSSLTLTSTVVDISSQTDSILNFIVAK